MPKWVEDCVNKISGTNPRTGKPYTEEEKWAICQMAWKKKQEKAEIDTDINLYKYVEIAKKYINIKMEACCKKIIKMGKAKTMEEAHQFCINGLSKAGFDFDKLELIINMEIIKKNNGQ